MKAVCNREGLLAACQLASVALQTRDVKPILKNFKAVAKDGRCTLMATDLELGLRLDVRGLEVEKDGEAILPASRLLAILRETQDDKLIVEADSNACVVHGEHVEFEMTGEDPANFPDLPTFTDDRYHEIEAGKLREIIRRTIFAVATESARYSMTGVFWELEDKLARLVATDGRRLALAEAPAVSQGGHSTAGQTPVVPTKALGLLDRDLQDDKELVRVAFRPNEVLFRTGRAVVYSRLVEGRFPNYREVFPRKQPVKIALVAGPFLSAVRQAAIMIDEETKRVTFHFAKNLLTLTARGMDTGRSRVELPIDYAGKAVEVNFNPGFITEMLRVLPADASVSLELIDNISPALFKCGPDYSYLVMPLG